MYPEQRIGGRAFSECCWPDCTRRTYSDQIPLCGEHFADIGSYHQAEVRRLGVGSRTPSAEVLERLAAESSTREERRKKRHEDECFVYYVRIGDHIKIGYTKNVPARMSQLRTDVRNVLATEPGGPELERLRHKEFAGLRIGRREDFWPHDRLLRHIELIRETYGPPRVHGK